MQKRYSMLAAALAFPLLILGACAKKPDQIAAADIGDTGYDRYSCRQLANEETKVTQDLENLGAQQKTAASGDAWGVFLLGLPVSSMSGNDKEAQIAVAKGRIQAIDQAQVERGCS